MLIAQLFPVLSQPYTVKHEDKGLGQEKVTLHTLYVLFAKAPCPDSSPLLH